LDRFNKLTEDEKQVERIQENLRMGKWAVGEKIRSYDEDIWEMEQQQRREMGLIDFPDRDELEGGYDFRQHAQEDDE
jgi:hypothetical protein